MAFFEKRNRKNDDPPRFPAWIVVLIAIGLVLIIAVLFRPTPQNDSMLVQPTFEGIELTATYIIQQATAIVQGTPQTGVVSSNNNLNPIEMTATSIVQQATYQAGTPGS